MKRLLCYEASSLDDLLAAAASFDDGRLSLDACEINELLNLLVAAAQTKLGKNSQLRLGSSSLEKDSSGNVTVRLKRVGLSLQVPCTSHTQAA